MPYISKKSFERLQRAGNAMGNICFNLSQRDGQESAAIMKESQVEWDAAKEALRREFIRKGDTKEI